MVGGLTDIRWLYYGCGHRFMLNGDAIQSCSHGGKKGKLQWLWRFVSRVTRGGRLFSLVGVAVSVKNKGNVVVFVEV